MDETRTLRGSKRDVCLHTFFLRTAALRHLRDEHSWFETLISDIVENKLRPATPPPSGPSSALPPPPASAPGAASAPPTPPPPSFLLTLRAYVLPKVLRLPSNSRGEPLAAFSAADAAAAGYSFALTLLGSATPDGAVDEWILSRRALAELDEQEPIFRPFVVCIAKNLLGRTKRGAKMRVYTGAILSVADMLSDIAMIFQFFRHGQAHAAIVTIALISLNLLVQILIACVQNSRQPRLVLLQEVLIVLSCLKPGVDARRVARGGEKDPLLHVPPITVMVMSKAAELAIEAIP